MPIAPSTVRPPETIEVNRALLSVADKTGIVDFARRLADQGVELVSTGGTRAVMAAAGLAVTDVSDVTGFPEIMDGRVKTLHPGIHGGLLGVRDNPEHTQAMRDNGITGIDLLVSDLYPFEKVLAASADRATLVENIDIGGPAMIRAAAKNHAYVAVVTDPGDYDLVIETMSRSGGHIGLDFRRRLAAKAFARTAAYDSLIANWFADDVGVQIPRHRSLSGSLALEMRYGENPHQGAGLYLSGETAPGAATAELLQGKAMSYNNINDTDAAFECVSEFDPSAGAAVAIIKHANPCGVATAPTLLEAYQLARRCDPVSAFGGIIAVNGPLDAPTAEAIGEEFAEVVIAPQIDEEARQVFARKKNLRVLVTGSMADPTRPGLAAKTVAGGLLVQQRDNAVITATDVKIVTERAPTGQEMADLVFAFRVAKHVRSNAIVYARDGATVGIGAGQMSRVDSSRIAAIKARDAAKAAGLGEGLTVGSVVASDAFFPFADGLLAAVEAGATAVIQPGGSMRDAEVIAAANKAGIAMVFTGVRHFRH